MKTFINPVIILQYFHVLRVNIKSKVAFLFTFDLRYLFRFTLIQKRTVSVEFEHACFKDKFVL